MDMLHSISCQIRNLLKVLVVYLLKLTKYAKNLHIYIYIHMTFYITVSLFIEAITCHYLLWVQNSKQNESNNICKQTNTKTNAM